MISPREEYSRPSFLSFEISIFNVSRCIFFVFLFIFCHFITVNSFLDLSLLTFSVNKEKVSWEKRQRHGILHTITRLVSTDEWGLAHLLTSSASGRAAASPRACSLDRSTEHMMTGIPARAWLDVIPHAGRRKRIVKTTAGPAEGTVGRLAASWSKRLRLTSVSATPSRFCANHLFMDGARFFLFFFFALISAKCGLPLNNLI